jgi:uncharacterized membrane protein YeaQ/YmgE (transglycosylase-associated protein family)
MPHKLHEVEHKLPGVISFRLLRPFTLEIAFDDGIRREVNFEDVLAGELYGPLRDPAVFESVKLDPDLGNLVWPNGADFDPEILHDWPERRAAFIAASKRWKERAHARTYRFFLVNLVLYVAIGLWAGIVAKFVTHTHLGALETGLTTSLVSVGCGLLGHLLPLPKAQEQAEQHANSIGFTGALAGAIIFLLIARSLFM